MITKADIQIVDSVIEHIDEEIDKQKKLIAQYKEFQKSLEGRESRSLRYFQARFHRLAQKLENDIPYLEHLLEELCEFLSHNTDIPQGELDEQN